jgi:hypothetical protein
MKTQKTAFYILPILGLLFGFALSAPQAEASLFNMARFVEPGKNAVGFEPEVTLTHGGGVAGNVRYTQGISYLNNLHLNVGMGSGHRRFRTGAAFTFDFFPDVGNQPGIGLGTQATYYRYKGGYGQLETALVPYIHKAFHSGNGQQIEPFLAVPVGPAFRSGEYQWTTQVVMGAIYRRNDTDLQFVGEVGVSVNKSESYISGGILYQP